MGDFRAEMQWLRALVVLLAIAHCSSEEVVGLDDDESSPGPAAELRQMLKKHKQAQLAKAGNQVKRLETVSEDAIKRIDAKKRSISEVTESAQALKKKVIKEKMIAEQKVAASKAAAKAAEIRANAAAQSVLREHK